MQINCTYKLNKEGEIIELNSVQELDSYLMENHEELKVGLDLDPSLSLYSSKQQVSIDIVDSKVAELKQYAKEIEIVDEDGTKEIVYKVPDGKGTTKFITTVPDPFNSNKSALNPEYNLAGYLVEKKKELIDENGEYKWESEVADKYLTDLQLGWKKLTDYGTDIHKLFEYIVDGKEDEFTSKLLSDEIISQLKSELYELISNIKKTYGEVKFFTETPIKSTKLGPAYEIYKETLGFSTITGSIDIMWIDPMGKVHIRDFKVSNKSVGVWAQTDNRTIKLNNWWASSKKRNAELQLELYSNMLRQYGLTVGSMGVIPVKIDLEYSDDLNTTPVNITSARLVDIDDENPSDVFHNLSNSHFTQINNIIPNTPINNSSQLENLYEAFEPMSKIAPTYNLEASEKRRDVSAEYYRKSGLVKIVTGDEKEKGKFKFYNPYNPATKTIVYANTEEELMERLEEFVIQENENRNNELVSINNAIHNIKSAGLDPITAFSGLRPIAKAFLLRNIDKYLDPSWTYEPIEELAASGIFLFTKNNIVEIISLSNLVTNSINNLGKGTSLLGSSLRDYNVDEHKVLKATNGNLDLFKVMSYLNHFSEKFSGFKINKIQSLNIWQQTGTSEYLSTLFDNFKQASELYNFPLNLSESNFSDIVTSTIDTIQDICGDDKLRYFGSWEITFDPNDIVQGTEFLKEKMRALTKSVKGNERLLEAIRTNNWSWDDPIQAAYMYLGKALNKLNGISVYVEADPTKWISANTSSFHSGLNVNSINNSPSLNARSIGQIVNVAETHIRRRQLEFDKRIRNTIKKLYESKNRSALVGGEVAYFDNLFITTNNKIDPSFRLKHPSDNSLSSEESEFISMFSQIINEFKYGNNEAAVMQALNDGSYYDVPLAISSLSTSIHNRGMVKGIKHTIDENLNYLKIFDVQEEGLQKAKSEKKVYNKYNIDGNTRDIILNSEGIESMETQLEDLLRNVIYTYISEDVYNEVIPQVQGIQLSLQFNQAMYGNTSKNLLDFIEEYLTVNIYNTPIMDKNLQPIYKVLSTAKTITSMTALGFNYKSGMREMLHGVWLNMSRIAADAYGGNQFKKRHLVQAWNIIFKESIKNPNILSKLDLLNVEYGMANADNDVVQELMSQSQSGIKNFGSNALYMCNKIPDTYHRMGILMAKMIADGSYDAHIYDSETNTLIYDSTKDKRFNLFFDSNSNKKSEEYKKQKALYEAMRLQFNKEGFNINYGEKLPRAYTIQEATSVKSYSELIFGHFDKNTQMLAKSMFLGAMYLQFRTFISAKLETYILKPGHYDQGMYKNMTNRDGINYVNVFTTDDAGNVTSKTILETELQPGDDWSYIKVWENNFMEGIFYSLVDFGRALFTMKFSEVKEMWNNPRKRSNLLLLLQDMGLFALIAYIIKSLFYEEDPDERTMLGEMMYSAFYRSFSEANVLDAVKGMSEDFNPPAWSMIQDHYTNTMAVITGRTDFGSALLDSFGATRDFKYLFD